MTSPTDSASSLIELSIIGLTTLCCLLIIISYQIWLKQKLSFAFQLIMILFFNEFGASVARLLRFIDMDNVHLCSLSLVLSTGFVVAANFWTCFLTRIAMKQSAQPGRFIELWKVMTRNILYTYIPSIIICVLIGILLELDRDSPAEQCWRVIVNKTTYDYVIYATAFIAPCLIAGLINLLFLCRYGMMRRQDFNKFLLFPIIQILSASYYISTKLFLMFDDNPAFEYSQILYLVAPLLYCVVYVAIVCQRLRIDNSDTTSIASDRLRGDSGVF